MILLGLAFSLPLYIMVLVAITEPATLSANPLGPPWPITLDKFVQAWADAKLASAFLTSIFVLVCSVTIVVLIGSSAAYALVRAGRSRIRPMLLMIIILGITIPGQLGMVPLYQLFRDLHLLGTTWALIILNAGALMPLTIFLYAGFISTQSRAYEEAATIDGATYLQTFRHVVFPLLAPVTGTVVILHAVGIWNEFLPSLLFLGSRPDSRTLPVAIFAFRGEYATDWGLVFAAIILAILPIIGVFLALQRFIINGFAGGLRG